MLHLFILGILHMVTVITFMRSCIIVLTALTISCKSFETMKKHQTRREAVLSTSHLLTTALMTPTTAAAANQNGLAVKLSKREAAVLKKSVFNIPPSAYVYSA